MADTPIRAALQDAPLESIREIQRQAELCLDGTVQLAIAADQRGTTLAGICGAGAFALAAGIAGLLTASSIDGQLVGAASITSSMLFVAALIFAMSARPIDFYVLGYEPKALGSAAQQEIWARIYTTEDVQRRIDANRSALEKAARLFWWGAMVAFLSLPVGLLVFFVIGSATRPS